jgi:predicted RNase H-like nuclease (RuvC/YqgF family)
MDKNELKAEIYRIFTENKSLQQQILENKKKIESLQNKLSSLNCNKPCHDVLMKLELEINLQVYMHEDEIEFYLDDNYSLKSINRYLDDYKGDIEDNIIDYLKD